MTPNGTRSGTTSTKREIRKALAKGFALDGIRIDGWENVFTGLGGARDKSTLAVHQLEADLPETEITALLKSNDLARTIVLTIVQDALREGFGLKISEEGSENEKKIEAVKREMIRLKVGEKVGQARILARSYGGARIIVGANGAGSPESPMNEDLVKGVRFLNVLDKRSLSPRTYYADAMAPSFGEVETFHVHPIIRSTAGAVTCHESRMIPFGGAWTEPQTKEYRQSWDLSVLQPVYEVLRSTGQNWQSISNMLSDASQAIFKIKGLIDAISEGDKDEFQTRMELVDMSRSVARAVVLDADGEDFQFAERGALSGLDGIITQFFLRLAAAARMPVTILLGQAPAGLNATGAIDLRWWYDTVQVERNQILGPAIERIVRMIVRGLYPADDPASWCVEWPSLWQMTPTERSEWEAKLLAVDAGYVSMQVLDPMEVALSRFRDGKIVDGYAAVDLESKRALLEAEDEEPGLEPPDDDGEGDPEDPNGEEAPEGDPEDPADVDPNEPKDEREARKDARGLDFGKTDKLINRLGAARQKLVDIVLKNARAQGPEGSPKFKAWIEAAIARQTDPAVKRKLQEILTTGRTDAAGNPAAIATKDGTKALLREYTAAIAEPRSAEKLRAFIAKAAAYLSNPRNRIGEVDQWKATAEFHLKKISRS